MKYRIVLKCAADLILQYNTLKWWIYNLIFRWDLETKSKPPAKFSIPRGFPIGDKINAINYKAEAALQSRAFRGSALHRRMVAVSTGFYGKRKSEVSLSFCLLDGFLCNMKLSKEMKKLLLC